MAEGGESGESAAAAGMTDAPAATRALDRAVADGAAAGDGEPSRAAEAQAPAPVASTAPASEAAVTPRAEAQAKVEADAGTPAAGPEAPTQPAAAPAAKAVQRFELPVETLQRLADEAGLQWVGSDPDKVAAVAQAIAAEPKPIHVPRERKPLVIVDEGPLVLVETRRDLSQMSLPFENKG